ncbi:MAG: hypothetical protein FJ308_12865 [Planctomycetes bacterium]|nr:hypothetical protein [Planctomycetota bacterium]
MGFEIQIAIQRLLVPGVIALIGAWLLVGRRASSGSARGVATWIGLLGALVVGAAFVVSDFMQRGILLSPKEWFGWEAREPWMLMVWFVPAVIIALAAAQWILGRSDQYQRWSVLLLLTFWIGASYLLFPTGAGYQDKLPSVGRWAVIVAIAAVWNAYALDWIATSPGGRWYPLVLLSQFGCITAIVLSSYASLSEWVLVGAGVSAGVSVLQLFRPTRPYEVPFLWPLAPIIVGLSWMGVTCMVVSTFYVSESLPSPWFWPVLFLPSIVGIVDIFAQRLNSWCRVAVAGGICGAMLIPLIYMLVTAKPEW